MLSAVVLRCASALTDSPDSVLPANRVGSRRPAGTGDLPAIVISIEVESGHPRGLGRELRLDESRTSLRYGDVYDGVLDLEAWGSNANVLEAVVPAVERRLHETSDAARANGFLRLQEIRLDAAEPVVHQPPVGSAFVAWRQRLAYRFTCEVVEVPVPSEGGPIQRIDVALAGAVSDPFSVPPAGGAEE